MVATSQQNSGESVCGALAGLRPAAADQNPRKPLCRAELAVTASPALSSSAATFSGKFQSHCEQATGTMGGPTTTMEIGSDGVAVITMQNPPVNAMHPDGAHATRGPCCAHRTPASSVAESPLQCDDAKVIEC